MKEIIKIRIEINEIENIHFRGSISPKSDYLKRPINLNLIMKKQSNKSKLSFL